MADKKRSFPKVSKHQQAVEAEAKRKAVVAAKPLDIESAKPGQLFSSGSSTKQ